MTGTALRLCRRFEDRACDRAVAGRQDDHAVLLILRVIHVDHVLMIVFAAGYGVGFGSKDPNSPTLIVFAHAHALMFVAEFVDVGARVCDFRSVAVVGSSWR